MKRITALVLVALAVALLLAGCGVPQEDYDSMVAQKDGLQAEYYALKSEHDALIADTADWLAMSDDEKIAAALQAEMDRIETEKAAQIVAEEQAEIEAEEAKKQAEEEAERIKESVTLEDLYLEAEKYDGKFVRITDELKISNNNPSGKFFSCDPPDSGFGCVTNVQYEEFDNWKTLAKMDADGRRIKVAGTFYNMVGWHYILASEITFVD
jgi:hypothetical protein